MSLKAKDVVPINQVRAKFTELAEEVRTGSEKIITRNGESYIALVDARKLDYYHQLEAEHIHLMLLKEIQYGLDDVESENYRSVAEVKAKYKKVLKKKKKS